MSTSLNLNSGNAPGTGDGGRGAVATFGEFLGGLGNVAADLGEKYLTFRALKESSGTSANQPVSPVVGVTPTRSNEEAARGFSLDSGTVIKVGGGLLLGIVGVYLFTRKKK